MVNDGYLLLINANYCSFWLIMVMMVNDGLLWLIMA